MRHWIAALAFLAPAVPALAADEPAVSRGAARSEEVRPHSFDGDLADLAPARAWRPGEAVRAVPRRIYPRPGDPAPALAPALPAGPVREAEGWVDPAAQDARAADDVSGAGEVRLNQDGFGFTGSIPSDNAGDVGPSHYVTAVNGGGTRIKVFDKAGVQKADFALDSLWTAGGACAQGYGDPIVLYDHLAGRWLLTEFATSGNHLCVYVSKTANPLSGGFWLYDFTTPNFPDYPKYAVWPDAYYVGTNEPGRSPVYALDRAKMLAGQPATFQRLAVPAELSGFGFQLVTPADLDGAIPPPSGSPAYVLRHRDDEVHGGPIDGTRDALEMFQVKVDWSNPAASSITGPIRIEVAEFSSELCGTITWECVPQPGTSQKLDPLREPVMWRLQYRNFGTYEVLVGNYTVDAGGFADHHGLRWFELRRTTGAWSVYQQGTYAPDADHRWIGSAAMDHAGNLAVGYSVSGPSTYPGLRYAGRRVTDTKGTLMAESTLVAGETSQAYDRWGDYSSLSVDPADDCTFWFTSQYGAGSFWRTRFGSFTVGTCAPAEEGTVKPSTQYAGSGGSVVAIVANGPGGAGDTIVLAAVGAPDSERLAWKYLNGMPYAPPTGITDTSVAFTMPAAGTYEFRLFSTNGARVATSAPIHVSQGAVLAVDPASLDFANVVVGQTRVRSPRITNTGDAVLNGTASVSGAGFSLATTSYSVPPGSFVDLPVFFTPGGLGSHAGTLTLAGGGGGSVALTGRGVSAPTLTPGASTATTGQLLNVTVVDTVAYPKDWVALALTGADNLVYSAWSYLDGTQVPPSSPIPSATLQFRMPSTAGRYELRLFESAGFTRLATSAAIDVAAGPVLEVSPSPLAFGSVTVNASRNLSVTVKNTGTQGLTGSAQVAGAGFSLVGASTYSLAPSGTATLTVRFTPTGTTGFTGSLNLSGAAGATVPLSGTGITGPSISSSATAAATGQTITASVAGGPANATDWVALARTGTAPNTFLAWKYLNGQQTPPASGLAAASVPFTLAASEGTYELRFFASNGFTLLATSPLITVAAAPVLELSTGTLDFGTVPVGVAKNLNLTLRNAGMGTLNGQPQLAGSGTFSISTNPYSLAAGQAVTYTVRYTPDAQTSHTGTLTLTGGGGAVVNLLGSGTAGSTVTPASTSAAGGQPLPVTVANGPGNTTDWLALASAGAANTVYLDWRYLNGAQTPPATGLSNATVNFTMPAAGGQYEFRLFQANGFARLATSPAVTVTGPTVTPSSTSVATGALVDAQVANGPGNPRDWVALSLAGSSNTAYVAWRYLNGTQTPPGTGLTSATVPFTMPSAGGTYELRLYANDGYTRLATSAPITVTAPPASITPSTSTVAPGGSLTATIANGPGNRTDWVAVAAVGAPDSAYLSWRYLNGLQTPPATGLTSATLNITMPTAPGSYELRFYANDGSTRLATSTPVTVQ